MDADRRGGSLGDSVGRRRSAARSIAPMGKASIVYSASAEVNTRMYLFLEILLVMFAIGIAAALIAIVVIGFSFALCWLCRWLLAPFEDPLDDSLS